MDIIVMEDNDLIVLGQVHVKLRSIAANFVGQFQRGDRVLRAACRIPVTAMSDDLCLCVQCVAGDACHDSDEERLDAVCHNCLWFIRVIKTVCFFWPLLLLRVVIR